MCHLSQIVKVDRSERHKLSYLPTNLQKAIAMILASYDEWDCDAIVPKNRREALREETVRLSKLKIEVFEYRRAR